LIAFAQVVWDPRTRATMLRLADLLKREQSLAIKSRIAIEESRELLHRIDALPPGGKRDARRFWLRQVGASSGLSVTPIAGSSRSQLEYGKG